MTSFGGTLLGVAFTPRWSPIVDLLWERAKRYRRIAAFASDEEPARQGKAAVRLGGEKLIADKRESHPGQTAAGD